MAAALLRIAGCAPFPPQSSVSGKAGVHRYCPASREGRPLRRGLQNLASYGSCFAIGTIRIINITFSWGNQTRRKQFGLFLSDFFLILTLTPCSGLIYL